MRVGKSALESALWDICGKQRGTLLCDMIGYQGNRAGSKVSFSTAALNQDVSLMVKVRLNAHWESAVLNLNCLHLKAAQEEAKYTPHLKIKLDDNLEKGTSSSSLIYD